MPAKLVVSAISPKHNVTRFGLNYHRHRHKPHTANEATFLSTSCFAHLYWSCNNAVSPNTKTPLNYEQFALLSARLSGQIGVYEASPGIVLMYANDAGGSLVSAGLRHRRHRRRNHRGAVLYLRTGLLLLITSPPGCNQRQYRNQTNRQSRLCPCCARIRGVNSAYAR
jgi:hypothetical protein